MSLIQSIKEATIIQIASSMFGLIVLILGSLYARILLAKAFYLNGIELARKTDPLSKMTAVHNFHISIEIAVKSILLKYEIRNEKTLNIDFETMLSEIDKHDLFQAKGLRLPYRQEIRNLNQMRNLVQHHAVEPDQSSMDDWRLFSGKFLVSIFQDYFNTDFNKVSQITFVADLKRLDAHTRAKVKDLIEVHLRHEPAKESKSRVKRLRGLRHPQYRLRIDDIRVFYDIGASRVEILAIIEKSDAMKWLENAGEEL